MALGPFSHEFAMETGAWQRIVSAAEKHLAEWGEEFRAIHPDIETHLVQESPSPGILEEATPASNTPCWAAWPSG